MIENKIVGMCPPQRLGFIRIIVCFAAFLYVLWEPFEALSEVPTAWYKPMGLMMFFPKEIIFPLLRHESWLLLFKFTLLFSLFLSMIGFATRFSLMIATSLYFVFIGTVRAYAWFFHTGLIPFYLLFFMIWLPSGDGISIDNIIRNQIVKLRYSDDYTDCRPSPAIGWCVFFLRAVVALCYFQAGYAKLHNMGISWIAPWNLKHFFIQDSLDIMHFDFDLGIRTMFMPNKFFILLAAAAIFSELFYPVVLFSRHIRLVYPLIGAGLHFCILLMHNIFFPDLILIQMIFYDWDRLLRVPLLPKYDRRSKPPIFPNLQKE